MSDAKTITTDAKRASRRARRKPETAIERSVVEATNDASETLVDSYTYATDWGAVGSVEVVLRTYHGPLGDQTPVDAHVATVHLAEQIAQMTRADIERHQPLVAALEAQGFDIAPEA